MALDVVAFAPGTLRFRAEFKVSSCSSCNSTGDGQHGFLVENVDYVFAEYDDGNLTIEHEFAMQSAGTATLTISVVPAEYPPTAAHDLQTTELADDEEAPSTKPRTTRSSWSTPRSRTAAGSAKTAACARGSRSTIRGLEQPRHPSSAPTHARIVAQASPSGIRGPQNIGAI